MPVIIGTGSADRMGEAKRKARQAAAMVEALPPSFAPFVGEARLAGAASDGLQAFLARILARPLNITRWGGETMLTAAILAEAHVRGVTLADLGRTWSATLIDNLTDPWDEDRERDHVVAEIEGGVTFDGVVDRPLAEWMTECELAHWGLDGVHSPCTDFPTYGAAMACIRDAADAGVTLEHLAVVASGVESRRKMTFAQILEHPLMGDAELIARRSLRHS